MSDLFKQKIIEWDNDMKMNAMFSAFPDKELNPGLYQSRLVFWSNVLSLADQYPASFSKTGHLFTCDFNSVREGLKRKGSYPQGIQTVLVLHTLS
jgi:hypothetical protein